MIKQHGKQREDGKVVNTSKDNSSDSRVLLPSFIKNLIRRSRLFLFAGQDFQRAVRQLRLSNELTNDEKDLIDSISHRIHLADHMYQPGGAHHYLTVGLSGSRCISAALDSRRNEWPIETILDFPCGHGRVLRFLRRMFPSSEITAAEIERSALDFCQRTFSTRTLQSKKNLGELQLSKRFDLIWCGSLLTHIDEASAVDLLRFFHDHLNERGLCVFTSHGHRIIEWIRDKKQTYGLSEDALKKVMDEFLGTGYGYADYPNESDYGISVISPERLRELAGSVGDWDETLFQECGWDNHQDVYAYCKSSPK